MSELNKQYPDQMVIDLGGFEVGPFSVSRIQQTPQMSRVELEMDSELNPATLGAALHSESRSRYTGSTHSFPLITRVRDSIRLFLPTITELKAVNDQNPRPWPLKCYASQ
jgi:hypothetical protein